MPFATAVTERADDGLVIHHQRQSSWNLDLLCAVSVDWFGLEKLSAKVIAELPYRKCPACRHPAWDNSAE